MQFKEDTEIVHIHPALSMHSFPQDQYPPSDCTLVTADGPALVCHSHTGFTGHIRVHLGAMYSVALDKCIMTCMHCHNIIQNLTALKIFCALPILPSLHLSPLNASNH